MNDLDRAVLGLQALRMTTHEEMARGKRMVAVVCSNSVPVLDPKSACPAPAL